MIDHLRICRPPVLDVLFCCDAAYVKGLAVAGESLLANASIPCRIHLATQGIPPAVLREIIAPWRRHRTLDEIVSHSLSRISGEYRGNCHFSRASFGKVSLQVLMENHAPERLLVLDPDIVVERDVAECLDMDLGGKLLGLYGRPAEPMLNAGVLLVDFAAWRERGIEQKLLGMWRENSNVRNAEQDLLERLLFPQPEMAQWLDNDWNKCAKLHTPGEPAIVHYIGGRKPWHADYRCAQAQELFYRYLDRTYFRGQRESRLGSQARRYLNKWRIRFFDYAEAA